MPYCEIKDRYNIPNDFISIYRYFDDFKAFDFIEKSELFFQRVDKFDKTDETLFSIYDKISIKKRHQKFNLKDSERNYKKEIEKFENFKKNTFINCWNENNIESKYMWDNYVKSGNGIAIRSTVAKLKNEFNYDKNNKIFISKVQYFDPIYDVLGVFNTIKMFSRKITDFYKEREIRAIIQPDNLKEYPENFTIKVDLHKLIDSIIISPNASEEFVTKITKSVKDKELINKLEKSNLL